MRCSRGLYRNPLRFINVEAIATVATRLADKQSTKLKDLMTRPCKPYTTMRYIYDCSSLNYCVIMALQDTEDRVLRRVQSMSRIHEIIHVAFAHEDVMILNLS